MKGGALLLLVLSRLENVTMKCFWMLFMSAQVSERVSNWALIESTFRVLV